MKPIFVFAVALSLVSLILLLTNTWERRTISVASNSLSKITNILSHLPAAPSMDNTAVDTTAVDATNGDATTVNATTDDATTGDATTSDATTSDNTTNDNTTVKVTPASSPTTTTTATTTTGPRTTTPPTTSKTTTPARAIAETTRRCILYDRPLRTGSTTIGAVLEECLMYKGYYVQPSNGRNRTRENVLQQLTESDERLRAAVSKHVYATKRAFDDLLETCDAFLYITSSGSMASRLISMLKYNLFDGHGNQTVDAEILLRDLSKRKGFGNRESFLEAYPYVLPPAPREKDRLVPHFVVRKTQLATDLRRLLNSLGCGAVDIKSDNMHTMAFNDAERTKRAEQKHFMIRAVDRVTDMLEEGDHRYKFMTDLAERVNERGLVRARQF